MAQRLAVGLSLIFCIVVVLLIVILYYPKDSFEEELDMITKKKQETIQNRRDEGLHIEDGKDGMFATVARLMEDFGAAFLALGAVICIALGLACIIVACCCAA